MPTWNNENLGPSLAQDLARRAKYRDIQADRCIRDTEIQRRIGAPAKANSVLDSFWVSSATTPSPHAPTSAATEFSSMRRRKCQRPKRQISGVWPKASLEGGTEARKSVSGAANQVRVAPGRIKGPAPSTEKDFDVSRILAARLPKRFARLEVT